MSADAAALGAPPMPLKRLAAFFLVFAFANFLSALLRAVTATLAPVFSSELHLDAADLGLLAGAYFLGFAAMQLPLGRALDHFGPRRVQVALLTLAVIGCSAFAVSSSLVGLFGARLLIGMGVSGCLMAPLTSYRRLLNHGAQLRTNSWMLMTGSLGMLASTLPVQLLLPHLGWRGLFQVLAILMAMALVLIGWQAPRDAIQASQGAAAGGYGEIMRHRLFIAMAPLAFFNYAGIIAMQALWAGPWLTEVAGRTAGEAAQGLFAINLSMLIAFLAWGALMPRFVRAGVDAQRLIAWGLPASLVVLGGIVALGPRAGAASWALWCVLSTFVTLSQPAVGQAFAAHLAGRALSAFNLLIFAGVFSLQWGIGLAVDILMAAGTSRTAAFRVAIGLFGLCCAVSYAWFVAARPSNADNRLPQEMS